MDIAHAYSEEELKKLERKFRKLYKQAMEEMYEKLEIQLNSIAAKEYGMLAKVSAGEMTNKEYRAWRASQYLVSEQMEDLAAELAQGYTDANVLAMRALDDKMGDIFAESANYTGFAVEKFAGVDTSFTLYDGRTVARLIRDNPQLLPKPRVKIGKDKRWNQRVIMSAVTQGILQGESMQKIAGRMKGEVAKGITIADIKNANRMTAKQAARAVERRIRYASIRTARTAVTGAENAGRAQGYKDAQQNGIDLKQQWLATLDGRTRHEHRQLDGQIRDVGKPFEVDGIKLDFPADPKAPARLVYNCRCTTIAVVNGHAIDLSVRDQSKIDNDYEAWKNGKKEEAKPVEARKHIEAPKTVKFEFTPAKSIEEAEEYANQYVDKSRFGALGVSYKGVSLDVANEINKTLGRFFETFEVEKFGGVIAPAGNTKYGKLIENATAAYSDIRRSLLLNRKSLKTVQTAEKAFNQDREALQNLLEHPERYDFTKLSKRVVNVIENSKDSGRATIPQTTEQAINHELGHSLERELRKNEHWKEIVQNMPNYNKKLSGYACESESEYIAESFCSYMMGEKKCDPLLERVFDSMRRKA